MLRSARVSRPVRPTARRRSLDAIAALVALALPCPALAQDKTEAEAQRLFKEGRLAIERGDYVAGCPKFAASLQLVQRASTLLNLAQCDEREGRLRAALEHWKTGAELLDKKDDRHALARERIAALDQRVPRLSLTITSEMPANAEIKLDGALLRANELGKELLLDPGRHTATVTSPGRADVELPIELAEGERRRIELKAGAPLSTKHVATRAPAAEGTGLSKRTIGFVVGGVGAAGLAAAAITGGLLIARDGDIDAACPSKQCSPEGRELIDGAGPLLVGNAVAWGVGLVGLGAGAWLILTSPPEGTTAVGARPLPGGAELTIRRSF